MKPKKESYVFIAPRRPEIIEDKIEIQKRINEDVKRFLENGGVVEKVSLSAGSLSMEKTLKELGEDHYKKSEVKKDDAKRKRRNTNGV